MPAKQMPCKCDTAGLTWSGQGAPPANQRPPAPEWIRGSLDSWNLILFLSCDFSNCAAQSPVPARRQDATGGPRGCHGVSRQPALFYAPCLRMGFLRGTKNEYAPCSYVRVVPKASQSLPKPPKGAPQRPQGPKLPPSLQYLPTRPSPHPPIMATCIRLGRLASHALDIPSRASPSTKNHPSAAFWAGLVLLGAL